MRSSWFVIRYLMFNIHDSLFALRYSLHMIALSTVFRYVFLVLHCSLFVQVRCLVDDWETYYSQCRVLFVVCFAFCYALFVSPWSNKIWEEGPGRRRLPGIAVVLLTKIPSDVQEDVVFLAPRWVFKQNFGGESRKTASSWHRRDFFVKISSDVQEDAVFLAPRRFFH